MQLQPSAVGQAFVKPLQRYDIELEDELADVITQIENEIAREFSLKNVAYLTAVNAAQIAKEQTGWTCAKVLAVGASVLSLHPLVLGSIACFNVYRVSDWNDLYSSNISIATDAVGAYSNLGHSVGYLIEGIEILAITSGFLLWKSYKQAACTIIEAVYEKNVKNACLSLEKQDFLYRRKKEALACYGAHPRFTPVLHSVQTSRE